MGSNNNPEGFGRTGILFDHFLSNAPIWSGSMSLLEEAYQKSVLGSILLEICLDTDDGVHRQFIETIQEHTLRGLQSGNLIRANDNVWKLWCINSKIE